jgi:hypothetical protein
MRKLGIADVLLVPNVFFKLDHRFTELEGFDKIVLNAIGRGLYVREAFQMLDFRLDRSGAELESEAAIAVKCEGRPPPIFNRPFLIVMRKRGSSTRPGHPFFVMWVDNAELLCRR